MLEFSFNKDELAAIDKTLERLSPEGRNIVFSKGMADVGLFLERRIKDNISGRFLNARSGRLRGSIGSTVKRIGGGFVVEVGSGARTGKRVPYANIQETGGTVSAPDGKMLTIPTEYAKTPSGQVRWGAKAVFAGQASPYQGAVILNGIIFGYQESKTRSKITPLFILKKSVTIKGSGYLSKTLQENISNLLNVILGAIDKILGTNESGSSQYGNA